MSQSSAPAPLCIYYATGSCRYGEKCAKQHSQEKAATTEAKWLKAAPLQVDKEFEEEVAPQEYDWCAVVDLEGKEEVTELPVVLLDLRRTPPAERARFHRYVMPSFSRRALDTPHASGGSLNPASTAVPWKEAFSNLIAFLSDNTEQGRVLMACCGNWDLKTQIPKMCRMTGIELPDVMHSWCNIKDFVMNFYGLKAKSCTGMAGVLRQLGMNLQGTHHLGMDDTANIARIILRCLTDGAVLHPTAVRDKSTGVVTYRYANRVGGRGHKDGPSRDEEEEEEEEEGEVRNRPMPCRNYARGECTWGNKCHFSHASG